MKEQRHQYWNPIQLVWFNKVLDQDLCTFTATFLEKFAGIAFAAFFHRLDIENFSKILGGPGKPTKKPGRPVKALY